MKVNRIVPVKMLRPINISEFNWQVWCEYQSGMFKFEIGQRHHINSDEVAMIIESVISSLRDKTPVFYPTQEYTTWQGAERFRALIREKFVKAPIVNGRKIIMSEL